jgi:hypothetical protein
MTCQWETWATPERVAGCAYNPVCATRDNTKWQAHAMEMSHRDIKEGCPLPFHGKQHARYSRLVCMPKQSTQASTWVMSSPGVHRQQVIGCPYAIICWAF